MKVLIYYLDFLTLDKVCKLVNNGFKVIKRIAAVASSIGLSLLLKGYAFAGEPVNIGIDPTTEDNIVKIVDFSKLITSLIALLLIIALLASLFYLLLGGIQWITSGGDKAGVEAAQKKIQAALIGLIIVFSVWALFRLVGTFLGVNLETLSIPSPFE